MFTPFHFACLCWISARSHGSVAPPANISVPNQLPNGTVLKDQEDTDLDSPFLQLRAHLPTYAQPIRPYTLLASADDYHYMPKPRHCRPSRLLRLLGSSFDPFWMSIDPPLQKGRSQSYTSYKDKLNSSLELGGAAANHRQKLENEAADLDLGFLSSDVARSVRAWMVDSATCKLHHRWVDLGPTFWPRWLRQTDCGGADVEPSCSFPSGMRCVRAQTARIRILAWHCLEIRDESDASRRIRGETSDSKTKTETSEAMKKCLWRQVSYPVVTSCVCSCE